MKSLLPNDKFLKRNAKRTLTKELVITYLELAFS